MLRSTYPEPATCGGGFFEVLRDGSGQRVADGNLVADAGCDDELFGLDECFQVLGRVGAELELAGVEVPVEKRRMEGQRMLSNRDKLFAGIVLSCSLIPSRRCVWEGPF